MRFYENLIISVFSYIGYSYDDQTSCSDCAIDTNVTVINPVMILLPYMVDKVTLSYAGFFKSTPRRHLLASTHIIFVTGFGRYQKDADWVPSCDKQRDNL